MKRSRGPARSLPVLPAGAMSSSAASAPPDPSAPRIGLLTLGCDKNTVDSERMLARLQGAGAAITRRPDDADVVVINTCGFIDMAKQESIDTILEAVRLKDEGRVRAVVAMGCLVQRYKHELEAELPEVDLFLGLMEADRLLPELRERGILPATPPPERGSGGAGEWESAAPAPGPDGETGGRGDGGNALSPGGGRYYGTPSRVLTSDTPHTAPLKISEGCDHGCAFCAIPLMRGKFRSTPVNVLVREARELEAVGVVELGIVSQDTTWYGRDYRPSAAHPTSRRTTAHPERGTPAATPVHPGESGGGGDLPSTLRPDGESGRRGDGESTASPMDTDSYFYGKPFPGMAGLDLLRPMASDGGSSAAEGPVRGEVGVGRRGALPYLLRTLLEQTTIPWLRLFYMYPSGITRELVDLLSAEPRLLPYLDMPIQHGSDRMLKRMRRPERRRTILERVAWLRDALPDVVLRTTVIVGFPGEQDEDFEALLDLLEEVRFDHLGAFAYSEEEGTAAAAMDGVVPHGQRQERLERLMDVQRAIAQEKNEARLGQEAQVLVDVVHGADATGRAWWQAPEVDGVVHLAGAGHLAPGQFIRARLTGALERDFEGIVTTEDADE